MARAARKAKKVNKVDKKLVSASKDECLTDGESVSTRERQVYEPTINLLYIHSEGRGRARIAPEHPEKLLKLFNKGMTVGEIATHCGISPYLARKFLHEAGAELKVGHAGKHDYRAMADKLAKREGKIIEMHQQGQTLRTIAAKMEISHERVRQILQNAGADSAVSRPPLV